MPRSRAVRAAAVVSVVLIAAIGWYLGSPLFIRTSAYEAIPTVSATPTAATAATLPPLGATPASQTDSGPTVIARGELQFVDSLHNGKGPVMLLRVGEQRILRFENVAITNAPDVHVYLSRDTGGKWTETTSLYLGALKATNGSFNYDIPACNDLAPPNSVAVGSPSYPVPFSAAVLMSSSLR